MARAWIGHDSAHAPIIYQSSSNSANPCLPAHLRGRNKAERCGASVLDCPRSETVEWPLMARADVRRLARAPPWLTTEAVNVGRDLPDVVVDWSRRTHGQLGQVQWRKFGAHPLDVIPSDLVPPWGFRACDLLWGEDAGSRRCRCIRRPAPANCRHRWLSVNRAGGDRCETMAHRAAVVLRCGTSDQSGGRASRLR